MPSDERANDLVHWQTTLVTRDAASLAQGLRAARAPLVSSGVVALPGGELGLKKGLLVRDPDGHVMEVVER